MILKLAQQSRLNSTIVCTFYIYSLTLKGNTLLCFRMCAYKLQGSELVYGHVFTFLQNLVMKEEMHIKFGLSFKSFTTFGFETNPITLCLMYPHVFTFWFSN